MDKTGGSTRFGQWLSRQRKARDLTQEDLAERLGCSVWSIQKIEVGNRRPSKQVAEILAGYFNIPVEDREAFLQFARGLGSESHEAPGEQTPYVEGDGFAAPAPSLRPIARPTNLTTQLNSFVGRAVELPRVSDLMLTAE